MIDQKKYPVVEMFDSFQGEGPSIGSPARFVRMAGCNLHCRWCDTEYAWKKGVLDPTKITMMTAKEMTLDPGFTKDYLQRRLFVLTGGEPMIHVSEDLDLLAIILNWFRVEIETNGEIYPSWEIPDYVKFTVSPKLASADSGSTGIDFREWTSRVPADSLRFKFVISSELEFHIVSRIVSDYKIQPGNVWIMPECRNREGLIQRLQSFSLEGILDKILHSGFNLSTRLHTLIWDGERGR